MSKIGRKPISIGGVKVEIKGNEIHYKGAKESGVYVLPKELKVQLEDDFLKVTPANSDLSREVKRAWGLHRALLANKIKGADIGFARQLKINGLGYKAKVTGNKITLILGFSHKVEMELPEGVALDVDKSGQLLTFKSPDRETLGQICSQIRALRPPEPYKGTGVKWAEEVIRRKAGKAKATT